MAQSNFGWIELCRVRHCVWSMHCRSEYWLRHIKSILITNASLSLCEEPSATTVVAKIKRGISPLNSYNVLPITTLILPGTLWNVYHYHKKIYADNLAVDKKQIIYIPWQQGSWGQHGFHLGPTGPSWPHVGHLNLAIWDILYLWNTNVSDVCRPIFQSMILHSWDTSIFMSSYSAAYLFP